MKLVSKVAAAAAVATIVVGGGATVASAYSISGGAYVGTAHSDHTYSNGGAYTYTCPAALTTFTGTATGADTTSFTPYYGGTEDCEFFGFASTVTQSGPWNLTVTAGPDANGWYTGQVQIPSGTTSTVYLPIVDCGFVVSGTQSFTHGTNGDVIRMRNISTGVELQATTNGIAYTASANCPFFSGTDGTYDTNGSVTIPGITIS